MGLIQLAAYGAQDIYLTGNPYITFFKVNLKSKKNTKDLDNYDEYDERNEYDDKMNKLKMKNIMKSIEQLKRIIKKS